jgi:hypothetical protein
MDKSTWLDSVQRVEAVSQFVGNGYTTAGVYSFPTACMLRGTPTTLLLPPSRGHMP